MILKTIHIKRTISTKLFLALIHLLLLIGLQSNGFAEEYKKVLTQSAAVDINSVLNIQNKYGNINIKDWEKDKMSLIVTAIVNSSGKDKAQKLLDYININYSQSGNEISIITELNEKISNAINSVGSDKNIKINFEILVPKYLSINLLNKYGNVIIHELSGHVNIEVKYGKLHITKLERGNTKPLNQITLSYSKGCVIDEAKWLKLDIKYSEITIHKVKALVSISKYSKLFIDNASSIVAESKYDNYQVGTASNFVSEAEYSEFSFKEIEKKIFMDSKYSNFKVEHVPSGFESIKIENNYGSYAINIENGASYLLSGEARYCKIVYPTDNSKVNRISENTSLNVNGRVGTDASTKSNVSIDTRYGTVKLVE